MKIMRTLHLELRTLSLPCGVAALLLLICNAGTAQIQQAWVARYNNGITNGTNQAVKMALDASGNIYVTGFSQNANSNLGYATVKYAPNGNQLWSARYDSTNYPSASPSDFALDSSNDVFVTGNAITIKYDSNGNQLWTAPYAGTALAVDTGGNVAITGFGKSFNSVKLSSFGSNLWMQTYPASCGSTVGKAVVADTSGDLYVVGSYPFFCDDGIVDYELLTVKYDTNGNQVWTCTYNPGGLVACVYVGCAALDAANNISVIFDTGDGGSLLTALQYSSNGTLNWTTFINAGGICPDFTVAVDERSDTVVAGESAYGFDGEPEYNYTINALNTNGNPMWTNQYPQAPFGSSAATSIATDQANNSYVTGYSPGTNSSNDIATIKYDPKGNQIWLQRYNGPGNGNDAGNAIAVDNNGNVYVAGYDTTTAGGTEMVLIKYSPTPTLQRKPDGTVLLETQGSPGESFDIEASVDLLNWLDLGTVLADTNGLMQFDDTNAPNYAARFYYTNPQ